MAESSPKEYKTLQEKEKLLVTSSLSFSHSVFKRLVLQTCKNQGLFGKGLKEQIEIQVLATVIYAFFLEHDRLKLKDENVFISLKRSFPFDFLC